MPSPWPCFGVADEHGDFGVALADCFGEPGDGQDFVFAGLRVVEVGDEGHFAVVVDETFLEEALVVDAAAERFHVEIAQVDGAIGNRLVEFHHEGLVFRANRADHDGGAVLGCPAPDIVRRIGTDGRARQFFRRGARRVENHARVEGDDSFRATRAAG